MRNTAEFDLVISILWSRSARCPTRLTMPDGSPPLRNGIRSSLGAGPREEEQRPSALHVYRNCSRPTPPLEPKEEREVFIRQWDSLQEFFTRWEKNSEGFAGACSEYRDLQEFEEPFGNISVTFWRVR